MSFDDLLSEEEKERIRTSVAMLEQLGFNEAKTISLLIAGHWLTIDPSWLARFGNRPVVEMAICLELGILTVAYIIPGDDALFIGGPGIGPEINENPERIFNILSPFDESTYGFARA
jgi:hypothetical protein